MVYKFILLFLIGCSSICLAQNDQLVCSSILDSISGQYIIKYPDKEAQPEGGMSQLLKRFSNEIQYNDSLEITIAGGSITTVRFVVTKNAEVTNKTIIKESYKGMNIPQQMFEVIESIDWTPGMCNGKYVSSIVQIPLRICLTGN